ncbi:MAG: glycosyltransferase family 61 protein [Rickettsiaceae bacterium]|nr:glycosyltransferase family 61 protein [Rickettsiaceae bacterium]
MNSLILRCQIYLANSLNWFATRSFKVGKNTCAKLIYFASRMDPSRKLYRDNLASFGFSDEDFMNLPSKTLPFYNFIEASKILEYKISVIEENKTIKMDLPKVINKIYRINDSYACTMQLPSSYLAEINEAQALPGTDCIMVNNIIIYDEIDKSNISQYAIKSKIVKKVNKTNITIRMTKKIVPINEAIHLFKDHSSNYFHWIVENLPRLSLTTNIDPSVPILVEEGLPQQYYDALKIANVQNRKIIYARKNKRYKVKKLYYPSPLSTVKDNYGVPVYNKDSIYNDTGIVYVRDNVIKALSDKKTPQKRRLFISRKNSDYRQLTNTNEIEGILISRGFEIVFPENLSFASQVKLFSQAEIIMGQSGAGMANFVFANSKCRILMLVSDSPSTNLHLFGALASALGLTMEYLIGKSLSMRSKYSIHADFSIDPKELENHLDKIGIK